MADEVDDFLAHYGVKGMRWGRRKGVEGVSRRTNRMASKDAKEYIEAKMYYGEGAGVRRRQIKAVVSERSKDDSYKKAFDEHVNGQDLAKASAKAHSKRKRTDVVKGTKKTARGINHIINGNPQYASAAAALVVGGAMYIHKSGIDKLVMDKGKTMYSEAKSRATGDIFDQIRRAKL
ncbi:hypothetical protein SEA_SLOOPYJOE_11 [Arthrobacter phage Sloopyjoe]|nr:hypothetical protein PBI_STAYER_11 [Arthrobacter phage Stayer]QFG09720.1 hypothetical protein PBI_SHIBA_11 [Arthrobacter phage Shiba]QFG10155.1 hypothetical protein PBI_EGAD_11 [Arthrobacter phage Egad]QFG11725.1 hypothetical protein PBI_SALK_11 [Arthrobacter phage Salk]QFG12608.1 hypothetical protein PBI_MICHELLE_11 [Arthrobacter phage Michelle]QFG14381.1 hypothetical protein PBI_STARLORD_11 [Arthrobacter phage StarLord]UVT31089.1 hypothetical protein PBI_LINDA_11 [Arthrobacter phage Lind